MFPFETFTSHPNSKSWRVTLFPTTLFSLVDSSTPPALLPQAEFRACALPNRVQDFPPIEARGVRPLQLTRVMPGGEKPSFVSGKRR
ncbi:unnamed protein product [Musa hybrid cultivar]